MQITIFHDFHRGRRLAAHAGVPRDCVLVLRETLHVACRTRSKRISPPRVLLRLLVVPSSPHRAGCSWENRRRATRSTSRTHACRCPLHVHARAFLAHERSTRVNGRRFSSTVGLAGSNLIAQSAVLSNQITPDRGAVKASCRSQCNSKGGAYPRSRWRN